MVETPPAAKRSFTSGMARISTTLALSLSRIGCGVALGASSAVQFDALMSPAPCLPQRRPIRIERRPLGRGHRQYADMAARHMRRDGRACQNTERNVAGDQRLRRRRAAFVRHVHEFGAGIERDRFQHQLIDAAVAGRADAEHIRLRLGRRDHVGDRLVWAGAVGRQHHRRVAHRADRREIAVDIIRHVLEQRRIDRRHRRSCTMTSV